MKLIVLEQRSARWLAWRNSGIGSSDAPAVVGLSPWKSRASLLKEKRKALRGEAPKDRDSWAMARGRAREGEVLAWHMGMYDVTHASACGEDVEHGFIRASFDGYSQPDGLVVEAKCPKAVDHQSALDGVVPKHYMPQCLHLMMVSRLPCLHYVSFNDLSFEGARQYAVVPLYHNELVDEIARLRQAEVEFWAEVLAG